jgi:hypothetical protein
VLIRRALPRVRPQGNLVYRLNRSHRLAADARAVVLFGPPVGLGRELVSGVALQPQAGAAYPELTKDGIGLWGGDGSGANNAVETAGILPAWQITEDITVAWRGYLGNTGGGGELLAAGNNVSSNSPWLFAAGGEFASSTLFRAGPLGFRRWSGTSPGNERYVHFDTILTKSASQGADIGTAPSFYNFGILASGASSLDGSGSGPSSGGPFRLRAARNTFSNAWQTSNIAIAAARQWSAEEHLLFHLDPYGVIEEAPRWYFAEAGGSSDVTVALTGQEATFTQGTIGTARDKALTGQAATLAQGIVVPAPAVAITGQTATFAQGTVGAASDVTVALTGQAATFAQGNMAPAGSVGITGGVATFAHGSVGAALSVALTGQQAAFSQGVMTIPGDVVVGLTGQVATFGQGDVAVLSVVQAGGTRRSSRGARRVYLPEPEPPPIVMPAHIVRAPNSLPDDDEEAWILLS